jgi:small subunit ribosomal protein S21
MKDQNRKNWKTSKKASKGGEFQPVVVNGKQVGPGEAIQATPLEVKVYGNNFDKALRAFRALVQKERVLSAYKEKQSYEKPSDKRRRKRNESIRKQIELCSKGECVHSEHAKNRKERKDRKDRKFNRRGNSQE